MAISTHMGEVGRAEAADTPASMPTQRGPWRRQLGQWLCALALALALSPLPMSTATPVFAAASPLGATLSVLAAPVEIGTTDPGVFSAAVDGQTLFRGDIVRTGLGGMALLTFFDGSESQLGGESQVQIEQLAASPAPQIAFMQTAGVTVNHVIPMPAQGSFRTDTPVATGLVRGTSYIVVVGSASTSLILLTDRNGHVGRVDVTANASSAAPLQLARAGEAATSVVGAAVAGLLDQVVLRDLEAVAHARGDTAAAVRTEAVARAIAATLEPLATGGAAHSLAIPELALAAPPLALAAPPLAPAAAPLAPAAAPLAPAAVTGGAAAAAMAPAPLPSLSSAQAPALQAETHVTTLPAPAPKAPASTDSGSSGKSDDAVKADKPASKPAAATEAPKADDSGKSSRAEPEKSGKPAGAKEPEKARESDNSGSHKSSGSSGHSGKPERSSKSDKSGH